MNWFFPCPEISATESHVLHYVAWFRVHVINSCVHTCMSHVADKGKAVFTLGRWLTFPSRLCLSTPLLLPGGCSIFFAGLKAALLVCRSPGFSDDSLIMAFTVIMCYKYAATCPPLTCVCVFVCAYAWDEGKWVVHFGDGGNCKQTADCVIKFRERVVKQNEKKLGTLPVFLCTPECVGSHRCVGGG